ncbi:MAG TPA: PIN domain-containing protein [Candidatus Thermoplasmatota archaeon]|nr:PIN domain-containing protein [Candidatus Thermoplasmatota archaeon]
MGRASPRGAGVGDSLTLLLDAGYLIALHSEGDANHKRARALFPEIVGGIHGRPYISDYLVAEVLNFFSRKTRSARNLEHLLDEILGRNVEPWFEIIWMDQEVFAHALDLYAVLGVGRGLSFTDCTSVALAKAERIEQIVSFDKGFDGILTRLA